MWLGYDLNAMKERLHHVVSFPWHTDITSSEDGLSENNRYKSSARLSHVHMSQYPQINKGYEIY